MNSALMAELCERIICSGGGVEAREDISGLAIQLVTSPLIARQIGPDQVTPCHAVAQEEQ